MVRMTARFDQILRGLALDANLDQSRLIGLDVFAEVGTNAALTVLNVQHGKDSLIGGESWIAQNRKCNVRADCCLSRTTLTGLAGFSDRIYQTSSCLPLNAAVQRPTGSADQAMISRITSPPNCESCL